MGGPAQEECIRRLWDLRDASNPSCRECDARVLSSAATHRGTMRVRSRNMPTIMSRLNGNVPPCL